MVAVMLLCGIAGAVVLTVAAGARRSSTSLDRLAEVTAAPDLVLDAAGMDATALDALRASPVSMPISPKMAPSRSVATCRRPCGLSTSTRASPRMIR